MPRGRPKEPNPRSETIRFRVTHAEYQQLQRAAMQHRPILSPGEYARLVLLEHLRHIPGMPQDAILSLPPDTGTNPLASAPHPPAETSHRRTP